MTTITHLPNPSARMEPVRFQGQRPIQPGPGHINTGPNTDLVLFAGKNKKKKAKADKTRKPGPSKGDKTVILHTGAKVSQALADKVRIRLFGVMEEADRLNDALDQLIWHAEDDDFELTDDAIRLWKSAGILQPNGKLDPKVKAVILASFDEDMADREMNEMGMDPDDDEFEGDFMFPWVRNPFRNPAELKDGPSPHSSGSQQDWFSLAEDNKAARRLIGKLRQRGERGESVLTQMAALGITGKMAEMVFNHVADRKVDDFMAAVESQDPLMMAMLMAARPDETPKA